MKRQVLALLLAVVFCLCLSNVAFADAPPLGTITTTMTGNNYDFEVHTYHANGYDLFKGEASGALDMYSQFRFVESGAWKVDADDIDRWADFTGSGQIGAYSSWNTSNQWLRGESQMNAFVVSDTSAFFGQKVHFDQHRGGVWEVDQWGKQRDMFIEAAGSYEMGFNAKDLRDPKNYQFSFYAWDTNGAATLDVDKFQTLAGSSSWNQWSVPDRLTFDYLFSWSAGNPGVDDQRFANRGDMDWGSGTFDPGTQIKVIDRVAQWAYGKGTLN